jgi:hypothetical protein
MHTHAPHAARPHALGMESCVSAQRCVRYPPRPLAGIETTFLMADEKSSHISSSLIRELAHFGKTLPEVLWRRRFVRFPCTCAAPRPHPKPLHWAFFFRRRGAPQCEFPCVRRRCVCASMCVRACQCTHARIDDGGRFAVRHFLCFSFSPALARV